MKRKNRKEKHRGSGEEIIINETRINVKENGWIIIGGKKVWPRKCNHCSNTVYHKNLGQFYCSRKHNSKCAKCRQIGKQNSFYGKKHTEKKQRNYILNKEVERIMSCMEQPVDLQAKNIPLNL